MSIPKIRSIFVLKNKPIKKIRQIVRWFIAFMIGGYVFLLFIVSYGPFHDYLLHAVTREIHANLGAECHVEAVSLGLFNRIVLDDVKLYDQAHAPLLFCQKISVKFNPVSILNGDIEIYNAEIINPRLNIYKRGEFGNYNYQFIMDRLFENDRSVSSNNKFRLRTLLIRDGDIRHQLMYVPDTLNYLDVQHLRIEKLNANISFNIISADSLNVRVRSLNFKVGNRLNVVDLKTRFVANKERIRLSDSELKTANSLIKIYPSELIYTSGDFWKSLNGRLRVQSQICLDDFSFLYPALDGKSATYHLSTLAEISPTEIVFQQVRIKKRHSELFFLCKARINKPIFAKSSHKPLFYGTLSIEKLYLPSDDILEISQYFQNHKVKQLVSVLGDVTYKGICKIETNGRFTSSHNLKSDVGTLSALVLRTTAYDYQIKIDRCLMDLKRVGIRNAGLLSFKAEVLYNNRYKKIRGRTTIDSGEYDNYTYHDIQTIWEYDNGNCIYDFFADDPHFKVKCNGIYQRKQNTVNLKSKLHIQKLEPHILNWTQKYFGTSFSSDVSIDFCKRNTLEDVTGYISVSDFRMVNPQFTYKLSQLNCQLQTDGLYKKAHLKGDFINAVLSGNYSYKEIPLSFLKIISRHVPSVQLVRKKTFISQNKFSFNVNITDADFFRYVLDMPIRIKYPISLSGYLDSFSDEFLLEGSIPDLTYNNDHYAQGKLYVKQNLKGLNLLMQTNKSLQDNHLQLVFNIGVLNNKISTECQWKDQNTGKYNGVITLDSDVSLNSQHKPQITTRIVPAQVYVDDSLWVLSPSTVVYREGYFYVQNFSLAHNDQIMTINGNLTPNAQDTISISLQSVNLEYLFDLLNFHPVDFKGEASGIMYLSNTLQSPHIDARLRVKDFTFNDGLMGDMILAGGWNKNNDKIQLHADISGNDNSRTEVSGFVSIRDDSLDLNIKSHETDLAFLNSFLSEIMSDIRGKASGWCRLYGPFDALNLTGEEVASLKTRLDITNVDYSLSEDTVKLYSDGIQIPNAIIYDNEQHAGLFSAYIKHKNLDKFHYSIKLQPRDLLIYDTSASHDSASFYGKIYGSGNINLEGKPGSFNVDAVIRPENSTFIYNADLPDDVEPLRLLTIVDSNTSHEEHHDSLKLISDVTEVPSTDVSMNLNLDITPQTTLKVIMDEKSGDGIQCNGNGIIRVSYFNKGKFQLFGTYTINEGNYRMSLQDVIRKDFTFQPGGTITFEGDPYQGDLSFQAIHTVTSASLSDLNIGNNFSSSPTKVNCILNFTGKAGSPQITFDLDLPNVNADEKQMVRNLISTEEDMNMQIIYLLGVGRFYTYNYNEVYGTSQSQSSVAMSSLLSNTLSNHLNSMLSGFLNNKNWSFGTNFSTGNTGWSDMEVEGLLSGRLLNNRLLINGNFGYRDDPAYSANFIGDFNIQWLLNKSGNIRLKAYSEINDRYFTTSTLTTQGGGIMFKQDFTKLTDLFSPKKREQSIKNTVKKATPYLKNKNEQ